MIRRYVAELVSDSGMRANLAGLRGASNAQRQLLFSSDVADIVLSISATNGGTLLRGQIFPNTEEPADSLMIQLLQDSIEARMTLSDSAGRFEFANLAPGAYALVAVDTAHEVQTVAITVSA